MRHYPRRYEDVFTSKRSTRRCKVENIKTDKEYLPPKEYTKLFKKQVKKFQKRLFDDLVRLEWLTRRFCYKNYQFKKDPYGGWFLGRAYGIFMRHYVGFDNRFFNKNVTFSYIRSYFDTFFPDFDKYDPYKDKNKYKYPFRYITLEYLLVVKEMAERMEILEYADRKRMPYTEFLDYIINYIMSYNDEIGRDFYVFKFLPQATPCVTINSKYKTDGRIAKKYEEQIRRKIKQGQQQK